MFLLGFSNRKVRHYRFLEEVGEIEGAGGSGGEEAGAGSEKNNNYQEQIANLESTLKKVRGENSELSKQAKLAKKYQDAVGDLSPERLKEIQANQQQIEEFESRIAAAASEAAGKAEADTTEKFSTQINQLTTELQEYKSKYQGMVFDTALREAFLSKEVGGRASDYPAFKKIASEYFPYDHEKGGWGQLVNQKGEPYFVKGEPGTPAQLMQEMRDGRFGDIISYCFQPINGSSGAGLLRTGAARTVPTSQLESMSRTDRLTAGYSQSTR